MLAPLQQAEAIDIRRKSDAFGEKVEDFRKFFQLKAPFSVPGGELKLEHVSRMSDLPKHKRQRYWVQGPALDSLNTGLNCSQLPCNAPVNDLLQSRTGCHLIFVFLIAVGTVASFVLCHAG